LGLVKYAIFDVDGTKKYRERAGYLRDYRMYIESKLKQQV